MLTEFIQNFVQDLNQQLDKAEEELKSFREKATIKEEQLTNTVEQLTEVKYLLVCIVYQSSIRSK